MRGRGNGKGVPWRGRVVAQRPSGGGSGGGGGGGVGKTARR